MNFEMKGGERCFHSIQFVPCALYSSPVLLKADDGSVSQYSSVHLHADVFLVAELASGPPQSAGEAIDMTHLPACLHNPDIILQYTKMMVYAKTATLLYILINLSRGS